MQTNIHRLDAAEAKELAAAIESHACRLMLDRSGQAPDVQRTITHRLDRTVQLRKRLGRMSEPATVVIGEPVDNLPYSLMAIHKAVTDLFGEHVPQDLGDALMNHGVAILAADMGVA